MADFHSIGGNEVVAHKAGGALATEIAGKADSESYAPSLYAGTADALTGATDTGTWTQRVVDAPDGVARVESVKGNTVVWGQLVYDGNFTSTDNWKKQSSASGISWSASGNVMTITITDATGAGRPNILPKDNLPAAVVGHKYLFKIDVSKHCTESLNLSVLYGGIVTVGSITSNDTWINIATIATCDESTYNQATLYINKQVSTFAVNDTITYRNYNIFDLTQMFGAGNEPSTVAEFESLFPESYYAYSAPTLLPVNIAGIATTDADGAALGERTFDAVTLRGAGSAHDVLTSGAVERNVGVVDLGTLTWIYSTSGTVPNFYTNSLYADGFDAKIKAVSTITQMGNIKCAKYETTIWSQFTDDKTMAEYTTGRIAIIDSSYTDAATFKTAMSGVYLFYELATPTTTSIDPPLALTYRVAQGGTEEVIAPTGELTAPPTLAVTYPIDADGIADLSLANVAPVENGVAAHNYAVGAYLVHGGTLYKVTSAIAVGESIVENTNVTATTVMAELLALS